MLYTLNGATYRRFLVARDEVFVFSPRFENSRELGTWLTQWRMLVRREGHADGRIAKAICGIYVEQGVSAEAFGQLEHEDYVLHRPQVDEGEGFSTDCHKLIVCSTASLLKAAVTFDLRSIEYSAGAWTMREFVAVGVYDNRRGPWTLVFAHLGVTASHNLQHSTKSIDADIWACGAAQTLLAGQEHIIGPIKVLVSTHCVTSASRPDGAMVQHFRIGERLGYALGQVVFSSTQSCPSFDLLQPSQVPEL